MEEQGLPFITRRMFDFQEGVTFGLSIEVISTAVYTITISGFTKQGPFRYNMVTTTAGTLQTFSFPLADMPIFLTTSTSDVLGAVEWTKIVVHLTINGTRYAILIQGRINSLDGLSWPDQKEQNELQKIGIMREFDVNTPAAGTNFSYTVTSRTWIKIKAIQIIFSTEITAADRRLKLLITPSGTTGFFISAFAKQTALVTNNYQFIEGIEGLEDTESKIIQTKITKDLWLSPLSLIESKVKNIQGADELSSIKIIAETYFIK